MLCKYWSPVQLACYDGEEDAAKAAADAAAAEAAAAAAEAAANAGKTFTQDQVNKYLADDRRKTEAKHKAELRAELQKQEKTYNELLSNRNLTETERDNLRASLDSVESQLLSEKEKAAKDKKKLEESYTSKLMETEKNAKAWETRYKESSISRELQAAAVENDAFNARQMMDLLRPKTELVAVADAAGQPTGEYQVMVEVEVEGKPVKMTPSDAVKKLKELPEWSNLFKANVVSGLGKDTGGTPGANGKVDLTKLSQAEYRKIRKEHPELIYGK